MQITDELIGKLARLARLNIGNDEHEAVKTDLQRMVSFIDRLNEVDTTGVEPFSHFGDEAPLLRSDVVSGQLTEEEALALAPQKQGSFFTVPKTINKP